VHKVSLNPLLSNARHGLWLLVEGTLLPSPKQDQGKQFLLHFPPCCTLMRTSESFLFFFCNPNIPYPDNHCLLPVTGQLHLCLLQLASWRCKFNKNARNLGKPILLRFISACDSLAEQIHASEIQPSTAVLPRVPRSVTCNVESKL